MDGGTSSPLRWLGGSNVVAVVAANSGSLCPAHRSSESRPRLKAFLGRLLDTSEFLRAGRYPGASVSRLPLTRE